MSKKKNCAQTGSVDSELWFVANKKLIITFQAIQRAQEKRMTRSLVVNLTIEVSEDVSDDNTGDLSQNFLHTSAMGGSSPNNLEKRGTLSSLFRMTEPEMLTLERFDILWVITSFQTHFRNCLHSKKFSIPHTESGESGEHSSSWIEIILLYDLMTSSNSKDYILPVGLLNFLRRSEANVLSEPALVIDPYLIVMLIRQMRGRLT
jgi:hypothetical protein